MQIVDADDADKLVIERDHRLGGKRPGHTRPKLREARQQGKCASLWFDKLFIDNTVYLVNDQNEIVINAARQSPVFIPTHTEHALKIVSWNIHGLNSHKLDPDLKEYLQTFDL